MIEPKMSKGESIRNELLNVLNYSGKQGKIADFFMDWSKSLHLSTCYYCNIDFVNSYSAFIPYISEKDFIRNISVEELMDIKGIGQKTADEIISSRDSVDSIEELTITNGIKNALRSLFKDLNNLTKSKQYNLFTLDHVLDKATHPLLSLCLYNLVPSCYACNTKLKNRKQIVKKDPSLSPTSSDFKFDSDVKINLLFSENLRLDKYRLNFKIDRIKIANRQKENEYSNYLKVFRLRQRYNYHISEAENLIDKIKKYPDSYLSKIIKITSSNKDQVSSEVLKYILKKDIFGKELFEGELQEKPLTKMKRDIARQIGIKGVKED